MLSTRTYRPQFPLNQFIDTIWVAKAGVLDLHASHHAATFTELIFNFGDQFQVDGQNVEQYVGRDHHQILSGLKTEPFQTSISGTYQNIGLLLKPFCYGSLLEKFGTQSMNLVADVLREYVFEPDIPQFQIVEPYLLALFQEVKLSPDVQTFENVISSQFLQKGAMKRFNQSLSITQKSFIQQFKKHYLLTPSQYVKLRQVNYAVQLLQRSSSRKIGEIGLEAGFFDQSHFIRVFKKFCGATPKQIRFQLDRPEEVNSVQL